jgi:hypothetical protein
MHSCDAQRRFALIQYADFAQRVPLRAQELRPAYPTSLWEEMWVNLSLDDGFR